MRFLKWLFVTIFLSILIVPIAIFVYYATQERYELSSLLEYKPKTTTQIYDRNGVKIANLFEEEHRYYVLYEDIPARAIEALLAIEDTTFFEHYGINVDAILRAIIKDIQAGKLVEGASTITQQLVKNKLLSRDKKIERKIKEIIYSLKLEQQLSKEQILERYLNEIYYGHGYFGIKTAAMGYYRKNLNQLSLKEIAILAGLPKAPSTYAPTKNYEISLGRANRVIERMHTLGWIDDEEYKEALAEEPIVYDDTLTQNLAPSVVDEIIRTASSYGINDIKSGGYDIYSTIDIKLQDAAQVSLKEAYELALQRAKDRKADPKSMAKLNGAMVSIDSSSGDILALVGAVDYKLSQYNRATQGKRLCGSAFKPFIYQVAIDSGYSGASQLIDMARTYTYTQNGKLTTWQPRNYEKNFEGLVSLRDSLVNSRNLATINLVNDLGLSSLSKELEKFGMKNIPQNLSISLGTLDLSPLEFAEYFSSFANNGVQVKPNLIERVTKDSHLVYEKKVQTKEISKPTQAYIMTNILQDVVKKGTGRSAGVSGIEIAGKTGTTNNNIDGWFVGYSPTIESVVWFGNDDNTPMHRLETGGRIAAPAFSRYYARVLELYPQTVREFEVPQGVIKMPFKGKLEYFSDISKPPLLEDSSSTDDTILF